MTDDKARILAALENTGAAVVTDAWPREIPSRPVVLVTLAGDTGIDRRDDRYYLRELEYYVRVFAAKSSALDAALRAVVAAMEDLGYELCFRWEEPGDGWRQTALRYKTYVYP